MEENLQESLSGLENQENDLSAAAAHDFRPSPSANDTSPTYPAVTLKDVVANLAKAIPEEFVRVNIRRKNLWSDFKELCTRRRITPLDRVKIVFVGEPAVDNAGPRREFFSGTVYITSSGADPGIFERGGPEAIIYKILERGGPKSLKMAFECSFQSLSYKSFANIPQKGGAQAPWTPPLNPPLFLVVHV